MNSVRLKAVEAMEVAKFLSMAHFALSFCLVPVFGLIALFEDGATDKALAFRAATLVLIVALPVFYAAMGFILGLVGASIYNLYARKFGGVRFTLEDAPLAQ